MTSGKGGLRNLTESQRNLLGDIGTNGGTRDTVGLHGPDIVALIVEDLVEVIDAKAVLTEWGRAILTPPNELHSS